MKTDERELEKQLKIAAKTGKYVVGRREVQSTIKGSKLLVWSASAGVPQTILDESKSLSIPAIRFSGNPVELGRACGIPFRVSVIALKSIGDADIAPFTKSSDYYSSSASSFEVQDPASEEVKVEEVPATKRRSTKEAASKEKEEEPPEKPTAKKTKGKTAATKKKKEVADVEEAPAKEDKKKGTKTKAGEKKTKKSSKKKKTDDKGSEDDDETE